MCFNTQTTNKQVREQKYVMDRVEGKRGGRERRKPQGVLRVDGRGEGVGDGEFYPALSGPGHRRKCQPLRTKPESKIVFFWVLHMRAR